MKKLIFVLIAAVMLTGCSKDWKIGKCTQWGVCKSTKDSIRITDSTYLVPVPHYVPGDTSSIVAYLECNEELKVVMKSYEKTNGKYIKLVQDIDGGKYTVISYIQGRTDTLYTPGSVRYEYRDKVQQIEVNKLTWWQHTMIIAGYVGCALLLIVVIYIIYRVVKKIK